MSLCILLVFTHRLWRSNVSTNLEANQSSAARNICHFFCERWYKTTSKCISTNQSLTDIQLCRCICFICASFARRSSFVSEYVSVRPSVWSSKLHLTVLMHVLNTSSQTRMGRDRSCFRLCYPLDIPVHFSVWAIYAYTVQKEVEKQSKNDNFASSVMFKTVVFKLYGTPAWKQ